MADAPELRTLPAPVIDPADVQAVVPSLTPDEAQLYASLATLALQAAFWPNPIPPEPQPAPIEAAGLSIAVRLATAGEAAGGDAAGPVVSESIGGYTYRLATPAALDQAMQLSDAEYKLLRPWLGQGTAYDIGVGYGPPAWPADWWQRDLDRIEVVEVEP